MLEFSLLRFVTLDAKALRLIALSFWLPVLNRSLRSILLPSADTDIGKWLAYIISQWKRVTSVHSILGLSLVTLSKSSFIFCFDYNDDAVSLSLAELVLRLVFSVCFSFEL